MKIVVVGGGPAGYEAALVAAELGAEVTIVDRSGLGGACVLWDCVPSKTLCTTAEAVTWLEVAERTGLVQHDLVASRKADLSKIFARINWLAEAQSRDIEKKMERAHVRILRGSGAFTGSHQIAVTDERGSPMETLDLDIALIATGASPREMTSAKPDGVRVLNARQVYDLKEVPEHLIVVGSGATGAEFAHAFNRLGSRVTLVCSREHVLPGEDTQAAEVLEGVFERRGMQILFKARAASAQVRGEGVVVTLNDGTEIEGSHALITVGMVPNSAGMGLEEIGVQIADWRAIPVDGVSRTNLRHIYAAGDVTGNFMLASVAAMQGRIAMWHALGQAVGPLRFDAIASTVFTDPEIATVGMSQKQAEERGIRVDTLSLPLATNARAKMIGFEDGFVKIVASPGSGTVIGGTVVAPHASDLILPLSIAVHSRLTVAQVAQAFSIYPSLSGSIQEAARQLMNHA
ncbi:MAG: NAD(P)H-quinone dehydrogenase [Actinomycetota bacterium]